MSFFAFVIYSFIYLVGLGALIASVLGVSPFLCISLKTNEVFLNPFEDWILLYHQFQWGEWAVDSGRNLAIFLSFILFFPCWILLWFLLRHFCSFKFLKAPFHYFKRKKLEKASLDTSSVAKRTTSRPFAMPKSASYGSVLPSQEQLNEQPSQSQPPSPSHPDTQQTSQEPAQDTMTQPDGHTESAQSLCSAQVKEEITAYAQKAGFQVYDSVLLGEYVVPLVLLKDSVALLLTFLNEDTEWFADETTSADDQKPTWFATSGLITSPVYNMTQAAQALSKLEPDSYLSGIVVLTAGSVVNSTIMQNTWRQSNNYVVRLNDNIICEGLTTFEELLETNDFVHTTEDTPQQEATLEDLDSPDDVDISDENSQETFDKLLGGSDDFAEENTQADIPESLDKETPL